jgi:ApbE superfamily uncharacterized protein (UPF0280 family)
MKTYYQVKYHGSRSKEAAEIIKTAIQEYMKKDPEFSNSYEFLVTDSSVEFIKIAGPEQVSYARMGEQEVLTIK